MPDCHVRFVTKINKYIITCIDGFSSCSDTKIYNDIYADMLEAKENQENLINGRCLLEVIRKGNITVGAHELYSN